MNRSGLKFLAVLLTVSLGVVLTAGLDSLPRNLRQQIDSERTALQSAEQQVAQAKSEVTGEVASDAALFHAVPAAIQWPAGLALAESRLGDAHRDMDAEVERLLELVGLPRQFADRLPHQLSGGQARRVGVARALALSPRLVIADEPTAGLDVSVQGEVLNLLNDLRETLNLSLLIITHNLHVVRHIADRMAIMYLGRLVEIGDTDTIFKRPNHPYGLALLSANPDPNPEVRLHRITLEGDVPSLLNRPSGCEFHGRCPYVQPLCHREPPTITSDGDGHVYTCHYPLNATAGRTLQQLRET